MTTLILRDVQQRVEDILAMDTRDDDPDVAHHHQDNLYEDVLQAVAQAHPDAVAMAQECVRVANSGGTRWYA